MWLIGGLSLTSSFGGGGGGAALLCSGQQASNKQKDGSYLASGVQLFHSSWASWANDLVPWCLLPQRHGFDTVKGVDCS